MVLGLSQDGTGCCADDTAARILQSLQQGAHSVTLEPGTDPAPDLTTETAQSWGITQPIGGNRAGRGAARGWGGASGSRRSTPPARPAPPTSTASPTSSEGR